MSEPNGGGGVSRASDSGPTHPPASTEIGWGDRAGLLKWGFCPTQSQLPHLIIFLKPIYKYS